MKQALFIVPGDGAGGAEQIACSLASALARRPGWTVRLQVLTRKADPSFTASRLSADVHRTYGRSASPLPGLIGLPWSLRRSRPDLVFTTHVHVNALTCLSRRLGLLQAKRLVTRESTTVFDRFRGPKSWVARGLYALYGPQDAAIVQTRYMREHVALRLTNRARARLVVLANPVDLAVLDRETEKPLPPAFADRLRGRSNLLWCGRLIPLKQPELALDAFERLTTHGASPLQLVILGDGPLRAGLEAEVRARGLEDRVLFLGYQANPFAVMRACDFGLLTSAREGFPNAVLEMMACRVRKIIATPCVADLAALPGVTVTGGFSAREIADSLAKAIGAAEDWSAVYRRDIEGRSIETYLDAVLQSCHAPPSARMQRRPPIPRRTAAIRCLDVALALVGGVLVLPIVAAAAMLVKLDSPGPAVFSQTRLGRGERPFTCYKLRTMRHGAPARATHQADANALTRLGPWLRRTKIDELPQLLNVLRGEMSLVGPRPSLPSQRAVIRERRRLNVYSVRPGITGRAQVIGLDMSAPKDLAREDALWSSRPQVFEYVRLIVRSAFGAGRGDALRA